METKFIAVEPKNASEVEVIYDSPSLGLLLAKRRIAEHLGCVRTQNVLYDATIQNLQEKAFELKANAIVVLANDNERRFGDFVKAHAVTIGTSEFVDSTISI